MYNMQEENMYTWPNYNTLPKGMNPSSMNPMMYNHMMNCPMYQMTYGMRGYQMCPMMNSMTIPYMNPEMAQAVMCPMMEMDIEEGKAPYVTMKAVKVREIQD